MLQRIIHLTIALLGLWLSDLLVAAEPLPLRISVDTGPNHLRNKTIERFISLLNTRTDAILPTLYPSGQLSKDRDIPKALHWGYVDMGVVARLKLTPFVADMNLTSVPSTYGLSASDIHYLIDGDIGRRLNQKLEHLGVKVLGNSIDLGFINSYTSERPIKSTADYRGLKLRVSGGSGLLALLGAFGANAIILPFPDVPLALTQGSIDGLQTTHETVLSGKLWEFGLRYCYEDRSHFVDYVPIVSQHFWNALSPELQRLLAQTWNDVTETGRAYARQRQATARATLIEQGIVCTRPPVESLEKQRLALLPVGEALVKQLGMSKTLYQDMLDAIVNIERER